MLAASFVVPSKGSVIDASWTSRADIVSSVTVNAANRTDEAAASYRKALQLNPSYAEAYNNLGTLYSDLCQPEESATALREALRLSPDYAGAKVRLRIAEGAVAAQRRNSATVATLPATSRESLPAVSREPAAPDAGAFSNEAPVTRSN